MECRDVLIIHSGEKILKYPVQKRTYRNDQFVYKVDDLYDENIYYIILGNKYLPCGIL